MAAGSTFGALTTYRDHAGPWPERQIELLGFFAEHATHAIRTAELIDRQHREMAALSRLVRGLREQTHEHANRIHALGGLLALGDVEEARRFLTVIESTYEETYGQVAGRVHSHALAGLIIAETLIARQRSVTLELDDATLVTRLPERLGDVEAVTVVGNLLGNALDAVGGMPAPRRRVVLRMIEEAGELAIAVRDWGPGIPEPERRRILEHGYTTKADHAGVGLPLVADVVAAARGRVTIEQPADGTLFSVHVPFSAEADA
jgi:sensor histidine kinase regulating citrate/malate metabolism